MTYHGSVFVKVSCVNLDLRTNFLGFNAVKVEVSDYIKPEAAVTSSSRLRGDLSLICHENYYAKT